MKKFSTSVFYATVAMAIFAGCSNETPVKGNESVNDVNIQFDFDINSGVKASRVAANLDDQSLDASKFIIVAYALGEDGKYVFQEATDPDFNSLDVSGSGKVLTNKEFNIPVGSYKFLALYNVGDNTNFTYYNNKDVSTEWDNILAEAKISRTLDDTNLDVNEIFAFDSENPVNLSDEKGKVNIPITLDRVNSRIDVIVKKIYKDTTGTDVEEIEVGYKDGDVLGGAENISMVTTQTEATKVWGLDKTADISTDKFTFNDSRTDQIIVGNKDGETGDITNKLVNNTLAQEDINKGTCYYKGAYVLPFGTTNETKRDVTISFKRTVNDEENIRNIDAKDVTAQENYISLITVKLITLKEPDGNGDGDDKEDIFNPNVQYTVTINNVWTGVNNTDVEI